MQSLQIWYLPVPTRSAPRSTLKQRGHAWRSNNTTFKGERPAVSKLPKMQKRPSRPSPFIGRLMPQMHVLGNIRVSLPFSSVSRKLGFTLVDSIASARWLQFVDFYEFRCRPAIMSCRSSFAKAWLSSPRATRAPNDRFHRTE